MADAVHTGRATRRRPGSAEREPGVALGERLRQRRLERRISLRELARRLGISASLVSQIETGRLQPSVRTLYAIVSELGVSLDEVFASADDDASAPLPEARPRRHRDESRNGDTDPNAGRIRIAPWSAAAWHRARDGDSLGAAGSLGRPRGRVPLQHLRGRRGVERSQCARQAQRPGVRHRDERPAPRHGRFRRLRARPGRLDLVRVDDPTPAVQRRPRARARHLDRS